MTAKQQGLEIIKKLVNRFKENTIDYKKASYNETLTRRDFIDPFFKALGWDIDNEQGLSESYREVVHEDRLQIEGRSKAPDYSFRLNGGVRLFFVEAKKPNINIKEDIQPAYQVRRYGWTAKLNISLITDFEEFAVYDCNKKPNPNDKPTVARVEYFRYEDYEKNWDFLWNTFSKEAVLEGKLERYFAQNIDKKGIATVDKEFLKSLDEWRTLLAETISKENKKNDEDELNFVVQQTLDRIIFLRIAEARDIEPYGSLKAGIKTGNYFENLLKLFQEADQKYNSGLFDFKKDKISGKIKISNQTIKTIITNLYYPESPYAFSVLSVEILGSAYEQFLGKTITINDKGKAIIALKPEIRKAGGVYYTPQYVVDYIVENTIGKLISQNKKEKNNTPTEVANIKIVDPACGSGSFLLGAYQFLLTWHLNYYLKNPKEAKKNNALTPTNILTTSEKKKILLNNIFGVDIDTNAVEVTKLSLLLKCMEGETGASIEHQKKVFNDRVLPTLDSNIQSGNSLIDIDYYENQMDFGEERKIKPFSWKKAFPSVFKNGGFDAVIGNPPYLSTKRGFAEKKEINTYFKNNYKVASGQFDAYTIFTEKAIKLLSKTGFWGFIIPKPILTNENMTVVRNIILNSGSIVNIGDFDRPFPDANVEAVVICQSIAKNKNNEISIYNYLNQSNTIVNQRTFDTTPNNSFVVNNNVETELLLKKIEKDKILFGKLTTALLRGIEAGKKDECIFNYKKNKNCKPFLRGQDVSRYNIDRNNLFVEVDAINSTKFKKASLYETKKLMIRRVGSELQATMDKDFYWNLNTIYNVQLIESNYEFMLGVFNSKLISFWFKRKFVFEDKLFPYVRVSQLETIPFPKITKETQKSQDQIVVCVEQLLLLYKELQGVSLESKQAFIKNKIAFNEDKINTLVYKLYELTDEEIHMIEKT
jgi:adenine-specific DNA-methyltransferase